MTYCHFYLHSVGPSKPYDQVQSQEYMLHPKGKGAEGLFLSNTSVYYKF